MTTLILMGWAAYKLNKMKNNEPARVWVPVYRNNYYLNRED